MDPITRHIDDPPGMETPDAYEEPLGGGALPAYEPDAGTPPKNEWKDDEGEPQTS